MASGGVITITRDFGSLGRPIARKLAGELGIPFYDRDIVEQTAASMGLPISYISRNEENQGGVYAKMKFPLGTVSRRKQDEIFVVQSEIIRTLATRGPCVIVGRCADSVLRDFHNTLNVYIFASVEDRLHNCIASLGLGQEEAMKMILSVDKAREEYRQRYSAAGHEPLRYKHLMINSGYFGTEGTVELIMQAYEQKCGAQTAAESSAGTSGE